MTTDPCTDRLCLRLLRAEEAAPLREVTSPPGWVEAVAAQAGDRALTPWAVRVISEVFGGFLVLYLDSIRPSGLVLSGKFFCAADQLASSMPSAWRR
jgi:hypothetical protein